MYLLHYFPFSQHARRVVSLLEEVELPYELVHVAMDKGEHMSPEFRAINPNHKIPSFSDGDVVIHESNAILRYLCFKHDLESWYPVDLPARASVEQWLDWNQSQLGVTVVDIVLNAVFLGDNGDKEAIKRGHDKLVELMPIMERQLEAHEYFSGERPSIADLSIASNIFHLTLANALPDSAPLSLWYQRMNQLKGFTASLPEV